MNRPEYGPIHAAMRAQGYRIFDNPRGFDLNVVGVRAASSEPDRFDDWMTASWRDGVAGDWAFCAWPCTTDPGLFHLRRPAHAGGTAILQCGQYRASHVIARHRGQYEALCQKPGTTMPVHRDRNRDGRIDRDTEAVHDGTGINIHRASPARASTVVGRWSAGCQVFADPTDFAVFMTLVRRSAALYGNSFTYTLLDEREV